MQAYHCGVVKKNSAQSSVITQQGQNLKLKGCYCLLKKNGVLGKMKFLRDLLPQRLKAGIALCVSLCLTSYNRTCRTLGLVNKKDVLDCIETNYGIEGRSVGREKGSCTYVLGQITLVIELLKSAGHKAGRQATCGEPVPKDKWHFLRTVL